MVYPEDRHVRTMRNLLKDAGTENSRMVAAAIGGHLSRITRSARSTGLEGASDRVRDASLDLLKAIHRGRGIMSARDVALASVDGLEAELVRPTAPSPDLTLDVPRRAGPLRRMTFRRLAVWRS